MHFLRKLVREVHRRSVWQVVGLYLAGSWGVLQVVDYMTQFAGLPEWTPSMALVLLLIGLPITVATAFIQQGVPGLTDDPNDEIDPNTLEGLTPEQVHRNPDAHPLANSGMFTWRNAILGGVGAAVLLFGSVAAYLVMWTLGIGPVGNLVAQGVLEERDPVVLAAFDDATDQGIGDVVTEALRVDLLESPVLAIVTAGQLARALELMDLPPETPLSRSLAREVALREGFKALIQGEVAVAGSAYVISAAVVSAESGDELKAFRVTARSDHDLVDAIDQLSQNIRASVGESLRNIRAGQPLARATTASFEALRSYTEATAAEARGDYDDALRLLGDAVSRDPSFAMAYRKIAVLHSNLQTSPELGRAATVQAYENRDRLTDRERYLTEAYYHDNVTGDVHAVEAAYRNALRVAPDDGAALNNLALLLRQRGDYGESIELLERAVGGPGGSPVAFWNLFAANAQARNLDAAEDARLRYVEAYPDHIYVDLSRVFLASARFDSEALHGLTRELGNVPPGVFRWSGAMAAGFYDISIGRWREGMEHLEASAVITGADGYPGQAVGLRLLSRVVLTASVAGDTTGAAEALPDLVRAFGALDGVGRPWPALIEAYVAVGDVGEARAAHERWTQEMPEAERLRVDGIDRRESRARLLAGSGDFTTAATEIEALRRERACSVCSRILLAEAYAGSGRTREAIESLLEERESFADAMAHPLNRVLVIRDLGPLFEVAGDTEAALEAYRALVDAWGEGDPELQRAVRHAHERIAALGG